MKFRAVFLALAIVLLWENQDRIERWFDPQESFVVHPDYDVILFTAPQCGYSCKRAKELLAEHHVRYFEYDVESSSEGKEKFNALNGMGVPLLVVGDQVLRGYNPKQIEAALKAR